MYGAINLTEAQQKTANFEYGDVNIINPLAVTTFTRTGNYTLTKNESVGSFELTLGKADRLTLPPTLEEGIIP